MKALLTSTLWPELSGRSEAGQSQWAFLIKTRARKKFSLSGCFITRVAKIGKSHLFVLHKNINIRVSTAQRLFAMKRGLTKENDLDVGQRLLEAPSAGLAAGKGFRDHMVDLIQQYYTLEGWDPETG